MNSFLSSLEGRDDRIRDALRRTPAVSIDSAEEGETIKVVGLARCDLDLLVAPFGGQRCLGWEVIVETQAKDRYGRGGGLLSLGWYELHREHQLLPFSAVDGTGLAYVDDEFLEMTLVKGATYHAEATPGLREKILRFVEDRDPEAAGRLRAYGTLRVLEGMIAPGDRVGVFGSGRWEVDPSGNLQGAGYRAAARRLVIEPNEDEDLMVCDHPEVLG